VILFYPFFSHSWLTRISSFGLLFFYIHKYHIHGGTKMVTLNYDKTKLSLLDRIMNIATDKHKVKWEDNDQKATITLSGGGEIKIVFPEFKEDIEEVDGNFSLTVDDKGKEFIEKIENILENELTQSDIDTSIFKANLDQIENGQYMKIGKNKLIFKEIEQNLTAFEIKKVLFNTRIEDSTFYDKLTMVICPEINGSIHGTHLGRISEHYAPLNIASRSDFLATISGEKTKDIKVINKVIGKYYPIRNMILLNVNIFANWNLSSLEELKEDKVFMKFFRELLKSIDTVSPDTIDNSDFKIDLMVQNFLKNNKAELESTEHRLKSIDRDIDNYYNNAFSLETEKTFLVDKLQALKEMKENKGKYITDEIKKAEALAVVDSLKLHADHIELTFIETTAKARFGRDVDRGSGKHGIREVYLGKITFKLYTNGNIRVYSDYPALTSNPHPHGNASNSACFGEGDGKKMIMGLFAQRKFSDLAMMLWMWVKKIRPGHEYMAFYNFYDDRLQQGLPVFDEKGERITINDKDRIKTGEQIELSKSDKYDENIAKFKDYVPQK
jgi:hypothetical protein